MRKVMSLIIFIILVFTMSSCSKNIDLVDNYDKENFGILNINKDEIKIMQLTDIHLTYGIDYLDQKTYKLIDKMILKENPDLIVITGDLFMSVFAVSLFKQFIKFIEKYEIPWTIAFGNHEREYHKMEKIVNVLMNAKTDYLIFHYGPKLSEDKSHGYSNFKIRIKNNNVDLVNIYILDTKADRTDGIKDKNNPYDYLSTEQVQWFNEEVSEDLVGSLAFMHIPLVEYLEYEGDELHEMMWPQGKNTNFFQTIIDNNIKTKGVFVGHDHLNRFEFYKDGVMLAYGVSSGYNAYGTSMKGSRIIEISNFNNTDFDLNTYLLFENEVFDNDKK